MHITISATSKAILFLEFIFSSLKKYHENFVNLLSPFYDNPVKLFIFKYIFLQIFSFIPIIYYILPIFTVFNEKFS